MTQNTKHKRVSTVSARNLVGTSSASTVKQRSKKSDANLSVTEGTLHQNGVSGSSIGSDPYTKSAANKTASQSKNTRDKSNRQEQLEGQLPALSDVARRRIVDTVNVGDSGCIVVGVEMGRPLHVRGHLPPQPLAYVDDAVHGVTDDALHNPDHLELSSSIGELQASQMEEGESAEKSSSDTASRGILFTEAIAETCLLAKSAGLAVIETLLCKRAKPDAAYFIGSGKVAELKLLLRHHDIDVVIFHHVLSPAQQRNLEKELQARVVDRTTLILDIFAQRAQSHEGKLQVELAQLDYLSTRLVRGWTHLERQKGGIGLRGPGETQLETDRRLLANRVKALRAKLATVKKQRDTQRRARARQAKFTVALVGYTNAGKSTLFNRLTKAQVLAEDKLFATLDTTTRKFYMPETGEILLSDTVGFVRDLPTTLVAAFRATLEASIYADLLLHVVDASSPTRHEQITTVNQVLKDIGADHIPQVMVWNKIDATTLEPHCDTDASVAGFVHDRINRVFLSAQDGRGLEGLKLAIKSLAINDLVVDSASEQVNTWTYEQ